MLAQETPNESAMMMKKASLIIGYNIAKNIVSEGIDIDRTELLRGIELGLNKQPLGIEDKEVQSVMAAFQSLVEQERVTKMKIEAEANRAEGEKLLSENGAREGVKKLPNGVLYEVLNAGSGPSPTAKDKVKIHYHGTLADGTVFDSSVNRGVPYDQLTAGEFVPGFSAALQAMKVGDKWRIIIPSDMAYGIQGPPGLGPNRTLIFELELLDILSKEK
jgi:FKBP-type peptidyl-prolyl cis-trans isomerase FklB